ncbi:hypothetical protein A9X01_18190 [Mycobacterium asiaticum]|uniref:Rod shape-determining protein MreD n=1 Tax=Mycobacterium asiaticum TaxID=1790 RepID=A0A1A3CEY8_MYCAS|nr:hypothetical protein A9X01_18190 [Mycobacterium asiaticum]
MTSVVVARRASLTRELLFPLLATLLIAGYADIRVPMGLPGHRGLIWLTLLVAVVLTTHRRSTVLAVGVAAALASVSLHPPIGGTRYLAAAVLLYAVAGVARRRRWVVVLAAAPIHLVALAGSTLVLPGLAEKALCHMGFGLAAGALGWVIASVVRTSTRDEGV